MNMWKIGVYSLAIGLLSAQASFAQVDDSIYGTNRVVYMPLQENGFTESMNGKIRDEFLNAHWFTSLSEAQRLAAEWLYDYNHVRPHSSLNYLTPMQFAQRQEAGGARLVAVTPPASCRIQTKAIAYQRIQLPRGT